MVIEDVCHPLDDNDAGIPTTTDDAGVPIVVHSGNGMMGRMLFYRWYYGGYSSPMPRGTRIINNGAGFGSFRPDVSHSYLPHPTLVGVDLVALVAALAVLADLVELENNQTQNRSKT